MVVLPCAIVVCNSLLLFFLSFSVLIWCEWMQFNVKSSMCDAVDGTRIICALTTNNKIQETILHSTLLHRWCRLCCNIHGNTFFSANQWQQEPPRCHFIPYCTSTLQFKKNESNLFYMWFLLDNCNRVWIFINTPNFFPERTIRTMQKKLLIAFLLGL